MPPGAQGGVQHQQHQQHHQQQKHHQQQQPHHQQHHKQHSRQKLSRCCSGYTYSKMNQKSLKIGVKQGGSIQQKNTRVKKRLSNLAKASVISSNLLW